MKRHLLHFVLALMAIAYAAAAKSAEKSTASSVALGSNSSGGIGAVGNISTTTAMSPAATKGVHFDVDASLSSNLHREESSQADRGSSMEVVVGGDLSQHVGVSATTGLQQTYSGLQKTDLFNSVLAISYKNITLNPDTKIGVSLRATLPTEKVSREEKGLRAGFSLRPSLSYDTALFKKPLKNIAYLDLLQNVHKYKTDNNGQGNLQYRARIYLASTLQLSSRWDFTLTAYYNAGRTYANALRTGYGFGEELARNFKNNFSAYLALANDGDALAANGVDSNVEVFDANTSVISAGFRKSF